MFILRVLHKSEYLLEAFAGESAESVERLLGERIVFSRSLKFHISSVVRHHDI